MPISIVIPLYNKARSIEQTIRCIQVQTVNDYEIVIVDGYSKDGSLEIVQRLAKEDPRIHIYMQENRHGVTPARNESVQHAQYDYIAFMDADDYWEPTYLETLTRLITDFPEAGIYGIGYGTMMGKKKIINHQSSISNNFRGLLPENPWRAWGCPFWTSATAISKKAFEKVGGFDNRIIYGEDIDLWYRIMLQFRGAFDGTQTLAYYRVDAENRACNHVFPLHIHIPYYIDKYKADRDANAEFRKFFDIQVLYRLFPYCFEKQYRKDVRHILQQIDWKQQKRSMYWRFRFPHIYRAYMNWKGRRMEDLETYTGGRA